MQIYTTGEIANICCVAPRTVAKWIDKGLLKGYRIPGSKDRRVAKADLIEFMENSNMPLDGFTMPSKTVLVIDTVDSSTADVLKTVVEAELKYKVEIATALFVAGLKIAQLNPSVILVNVESFGRDILRSLSEQKLSKVVATGKEFTDSEANELKRLGADIVMKGTSIGDAVMCIAKA